jgi:hypothetical protein
MEAGIVGQLGVEGRRQHRSFADRDRVALVASQDFGPGPAALDPRGADKDRAQRLVADSLHLEVGLKALQLAAEGVAPRGRVDQPEVGVVADDQASAGAEDRGPLLVQAANLRLQAGRLDQLADRGALAAGDDQAVEPLEIGRRTDLGDLGAKLAQRAGVRLEVALQR